MRMPLQATALALVLGTALGSFPLDVGYGIMPRANGNLQNFNGALGGVAPDPITSTGDPERPFEVDGNTFTTLSSAVDRSCSNQHSACADAANKQGNGKDGQEFTVGSCDTQQASCVAAGASKAIKSAPESTTVAFAALTGLPQSSDDKFFYFCDP